MVFDLFDVAGGFEMTASDGHQREGHETTVKNRNSSLE